MRTNFATDETRSHITFSLSSLMLVVTLISMVLGILSVVPDLAVPLAVVAVLALIRTTCIANRRSLRGRPMGIDERVRAYFASTGVVLLIGFATCAALCAACIGGFFFGTTLSVLFGPKHLPDASLMFGASFGLFLGPPAALYALHLMTRRFWLRENGPSQ